MPTEDEAERAERLEKERVPTPELEQPFIAPASLHLPPGIEMPATQKLNLIIERTAAFIAGQNPQMEIVIKARQAKNPQFDFLNYDHYLNPYYRHIVKCIKAGTYVPQPTGKESPKEEEDEDSDDDAGYLHPGLLGSKEPKKPSVAPVIQQPPSSFPTTHAYSVATSGYAIPSSSYQSTTRSLAPPPEHEEVAPPAQTLIPQMTDVAPPVIEPVPEPTPEQPPPTTAPEPATGEADILAAYYATAASELVNAFLTALASAPPPPPGSETTPQQHLDGTPISTELAPGLDASQPLPPGTEQIPGLNPVPMPTVIPPPPDIQPIIDKLAEFVAKNGDEFENSVREKGDPRFEFLNSWHSFYPYYEQKKIIFRREAEERQQEQLNEQKAPVSFSIKPRDVDERVLVGRSALPVEESDSEEELPETKKPPAGSLDQAAGMDDLINLTKQQIALAMAGATLGKGDQPQLESFSEASSRAIGDQFDPNSRPRIAGLFEEKPKEIERPLWGKVETPSARPVSVDYNHGQRHRVPAPPSVPPPPRSRDYSRFAERSAPLSSGPGRPSLYQERLNPVRPPPKAAPPFVSREELARKQAEKMKLENKLAQAARQRMAGISKERQLQLERKKKAALFMSRMKDQPPSGEGSNDTDSDSSGHSGGRNQQGSPRRRSLSPKKQKGPPPKPTPKAYQVTFGTRPPEEPERRKRSRSRSPPPPTKSRRSSSPVMVKAKKSESSRLESTTLGAALAPFRKRSDGSRESSPGSSSSGLLKSKGISPGTLGEMIKKKNKESSEGRKAKIKKLVGSSKPSKEDEVIIHID
ncbi:Splicing factor, suppressor of white-apricot-like [Holothuria leucospilota]|uniref:Splicing factor, suppressor of white-apricot-like n=1 Tax=Holothuria leucospilota TaxID=206669 RepID=A0A9Q1CDM7_HOLLE|nr:Splicing factor, suppressor of white-apricot-like [Holothuria leucospilota]